MEIIRIPVLSDNYIFLLHDEAKHQAVVIDPAIAAPVLAKLNQLQAELVGIWNTHHHSDHVGGNRLLIQRFPRVKVIAGKYDHLNGRIPGQTDVVVEGDVLGFAGRPVQVFDCPGHTLGHIAYYFPPTLPDKDTHLFCGDTLFASGCGRLFEGTPQQMMESLSKFRALPAQTQVWCAHEYTLKNINFAVTLEPHNSVLQNRLDTVTAARQRDVATVPTTLSTEMQVNPFLRYQDEILQRAVSCDRPLELFTKIRKLRDQF